ncbi:DUF4236 domain-containing protein [Bacillus sp. EB600]|uniref:DUF4236 domain-containing protein n=1 Tax=Bacillus sp. EB600 TaxID=2806345 RepID=UPI002109279E|nr:DUF4236 domain-containing protein [Bacillus sp. EB600]MCQ6280843.1 DUF4236 domain-containing protein [Bacillus sp. EB600]
MGLNFRKSFKIAPGIRMNVGKKGVGVSFGVPGLRYTINSSGRKTTTVGIPGSGISYSTTSGSRSYKTPAYQRRSELARLQREQRKLQEQEYARLQVTLYENKLDQIRSIHQECDDPVDWKEVYRRLAPFKNGQEGPNTKAAREQLESYQPSVMERIFNKTEAKLQELAQEVEKAKAKDAELWNSWKHMHTVAEKILKRDMDSYLEVIQEYTPLDDLVEFGSGFEFGTDNPNIMQVSFEVNALNVIPNKALSLTKTGKLSEKPLSKTAYYDLYQDYVCSCALRIARDLFALLPVYYVFVHAYEEVINTATGHKQEQAILSVKFDRPMLNRLNFENLDPSDALVNFPHKMKFKKTSGFEDIGTVLDD